MRLPLPLLALACSGCFGTAVAVGPEAPALDAGALEVEALTSEVWVHTTYRDLEGIGRVRSNGLVVASGGDALLVDAAWGDDPERATAALLARLRVLWGAEVRSAVFSHHHDDSVGGIGALHAAGVPTVATATTADLMEADGWARPGSVLDGADAWTLRLGGVEAEVFDAGPGHTRDNVVVYVPHARVLYGGCLVRPGDAASLGNTADADVGQWAETVARVRERYPDVEVVVPSHGLPGGPELLDRTIALVEARRGAGG